MFCVASNDVAHAESLSGLGHQLKDAASAARRHGIRVEVGFDLGDGREQSPLDRVPVGRRGDERRRSVRRRRAKPRSRAARRLEPPLRPLSLGPPPAADRRRRSRARSPRSSAWGHRARRPPRGQARQPVGQLESAHPQTSTVLEDDEVGRLSGRPPDRTAKVTGRRRRIGPSIPGYSPGRQRRLKARSMSSRVSRKRIGRPCGQVVRFSVRKRSSKSRCIPSSGEG